MEGIRGRKGKGNDVIIILNNKSIIKKEKKAKNNNWAEIQLTGRAHA